MGRTTAKRVFDSAEAQGLEAGKVSFAEAERLSTPRRYPLWANPSIEFYHGTTKSHADAILADGIDPLRGAPNTDFGRGFYTTTNRAQAEVWAESKAGESGDQPAVLKITLKRTALATLRHLAFIRPTSDYWSLVERCRDANDLPHPTGADYDVVYGPVARRWWGPKPFAIIPDYDQQASTAMRPGHC